jgi:hypothetical protein
MLQRTTLTQTASSAAGVTSTARLHWSTREVRQTVSALCVCALCWCLLQFAMLVAAGATSTAKWHWSTREVRQTDSVPFLCALLVFAADRNVGCCWCHINRKVALEHEGVRQTACVHACVLVCVLACLRVCVLCWFLLQFARLVAAGATSTTRLHWSIREVRQTAPVPSVCACVCYSGFCCSLQCCLLLVLPRPQDRSGGSGLQSCCYHINFKFAGVCCVKNKNSSAGDRLARFTAQQTKSGVRCMQ